MIEGSTKYLRSLNIHVNFIDTDSAFFVLPENCKCWSDVEIFMNNLNIHLKENFGKYICMEIEEIVVR